MQPFTDGAVAQSVEQRTENPCVAGSIPAHTTKAPDNSGVFILCTLSTSFIRRHPEKLIPALQIMLTGG